MLDDFWFGWVYETVWVEDFRVGVYVFVSCDTPCRRRIVRSKMVRDENEELGERLPDIVKHGRITR